MRVLPSAAQKAQDSESLELVQEEVQAPKPKEAAAQSEQAAQAAGASSNVM